jgi:diguanylate cyclase (GGDEF)-like protein/PAS domain S-box-containing protein
MEALVQLGLFLVPIAASGAATGAANGAAGAIRLAHVAAGLPTGSQPWMVWAGLGFVVVLSGLAGAMVQKLRTNPGVRARKDEVIPGELAMLRAVIANMPDTIFVKDAESRFVLANLAAAKNVGADSSAEVLGKTDFDFFPKGIAEVFFENERRVLDGSMTHVNKEERIRDASGTIRYLLTTKVPLTDYAGKVTGLVGIGRNVTELKAVASQLENARDELAFKAAHDGLTGLINRAAILEHLDRELARCAREKGSVAVLLADLDHFKKINDTYGHATGDEVLRETAHRLLNSVRIYDLVGRYGGEEFLIVLPSCASAAVAMARAEQMRSDLSSGPVWTEHGPIAVTMSVGVLVTDARHLSAAAAMHDADLALYAAKKEGRDRCCLAGAAALAAGD